MDIITLATQTSASTTGTTPTDPTTSPANYGVGATTANYTASMDASVLNNGSLYWQGIQSDSLTGGIRPGNGNLSSTGGSINAVTQAADSFANYQSIDQIFRDAASLTTAGANTFLIPADPLVLDLNGDGVQLVNYSDSKAYFDIDNDGGSKEHTGWVGAQDGILVHDLNSNGVVDNIKETLSEYYNGTTGSDGNAGTKPYADGFAALKSLDTNNDNIFNSADAAWANLQVWVDDNGDGKSFKDTNNNGIKDAGEASELKTFSELGITSINLVKATQSGLVNSGNEVLATGSFIQSGQTKTAQAVRFIANPNGSTFAATAGGATVTTQGNGGTADVKSYASTNTDSNVNETLNATTLGVSNIYAGAGNDILIGDANANWLAGGQGSDTFNAGAGDDVLLIDANDLQANIHAGAGNDVVQVVGSDGVTLNLAQAEAEVAIGGQGNDVLIGGGRSTVFIRGGDGDDIVIGGTANDILSGGDGSDLIDGGAGNDLIRGQRGQDQLYGGQGDDVLDGGLEDDRLSGGAGNDVLIGSRGDDTLDGGDGTDAAEFSGSYADYRITKLSDANNQIVYRIVDIKAGRDGADTLINIEKLSFADLSRVDITLDNPIPVNDVLTIADRIGTKLIKVSDLLANDRDWQGDALHITTISDIKGGTILGTTSNGELTPTLTANGELQFIPDPAYTGIMSFKYKLADVDGTPGATAFIAGTQIAAEMRGQVFIKTPDMPTDSLFPDQWYLNDINVLPVWKDYTGKNVKIAQFEPGMPFSTNAEVYDYRNADLQANADPSWISDPNNTIPQNFSQHATLVAGVMVAARNGEGAVGIAYGAKLSGHSISSGEGLEVGAFNTEIANALAQFKNYDVVNNSWGANADFVLNVLPVGLPEQGVLNAVSQGRNGLGTAIVMAGGNDRANGGNTNYNALTANRAVITVGAINAQADISTLSIGQAPFSNPGASILISAPGSNVASTSRILMGDDGTVFGNDTQTTQGTSFATPIISGIVALMLEANPNLGYRDVQQILALSARKVNDPNTDAVWNAANNWNGGGMHTSHDYGFGDVDARAAVRLAETWQGSHTIYNERHLASGEGSMNGGASMNLAINDGATITRTLAIGAGLRAEHATVSLDVTHSNWGDLTVELISPTGTISKLIANPGSSATNPGGDVGSGQLTFALDTTHDYGENAQGAWQLRITDRSGRGTGTLNGWKVDVYGSDWNETINNRDTVMGETPMISATADNQYYYTDEFAAAPGAARATLTDSNGGLDIVNASAVSADSIINLNNGSASTIAGRSLSINGDVEFAFGGDGNDTLTGNAFSNRLQGGRGNDTLAGGAGIDLLDGGAGNNTLSGGSDIDFFVIRKNAGATDTITDFSPTTAGEKILLVGFDSITDYSQIAMTQEGANTRLNLGGGQSVLLQNLLLSQVSEQNFGFLSDDKMLDKYATYMSNASISWGTSGVENMLLPNNMGEMRFFALAGDDVLGGQTENDLIDGGNGNDTIWGDYPGSAPTPGADWLEGGAGNDVLYGGAGDDLLLGGSGADSLRGEAGNDVLRGATGNDALDGGDGSDMLIGGSGDDYLDGGNGDDVIALEGDFGTVNGTTYDYYGTRVGGAGVDVFKVTANGGGNGGFSASGTEFSAYNMIADFDLNQVGEVIDLTEMKWIRGFADLSIQNMTINGTAFARIIANDGTNQLAINLRGVAGNALNAVHFKFAVTPGLVFGGANNDTLAGDAGGNTLDGGAGADTMTGRTGDDTYIVDNAGDTVNELSGGGFDTVKSSVSYTLPANVENLVLTGAAAINGTGNEVANRIVGNASNNVLDGKGGADAMLGGAGNDTYVVDNQADAVVEYAGEGTDTVQSSVSYTLGNNIENLALTGTDGINATGNALANALTGNAGDNLIDGAQGADSMAGGAGDDTYFVDNASDVVLENTAEGIDTVYTTVDYTLGANVENLMLAIGAANGIGNELDNQLLGNSAANMLSGGAGNDVLDGGIGADILAGGAGDDMYIVDNVSDVINENAGEGFDTVQSSVSYTLADKPNLENVILAGTAAINATGNSAANQLIGNSAANTLSGGAGDDILDGAAEADTMSGGTGNDTYIVDNSGDTVTENAAEGSDTVQSGISYTLGANLENLALTGFSGINGTGNAADNFLTGNSSDNTLNGGSGDDTLQGGAGNDALIGGIGNDLYLFDAGFGQDVISENDAAAGNTDTIRFGSGITAASVMAARNNVDLVLNRGTDSITVQNWFASDANKIERVEFADGTVWSVPTLRALTNNAPTIANAIPDQTTAEDTAFNFTIAANTFGDVDAVIGDTLMLSATLGNGDPLPGWLIFNPGTRTFSGLADDAQVGTLTLKVTAVDAVGGAVTSTFNLQVNNVNEAPTAIALSANTVAENAADAIIGTVSTTDPDAGSTFTYSIVPGGDGAQFMLAGNILKVGDAALDYEAGATRSVTVRSTDQDGLTFDQTMTINVTDINEVIFGTENDDSLLEGTEFADTIDGLGGNDWIFGDGGADILYGGTGRDTLDGGTGADTMSGGAGSDIYVVDDASDSVMENGGEGIDTINASISFTLGSNIENLTLTGSAQIGGTGNDLNNYITGNAADNWLLGWDGDDLLDGGIGNDLLLGGKGDDTYVVDSINDVIIEGDNEGVDTVQTDLSYSLGENLENVSLTGAANINAIGNSQNNILTGNEGGNRLDGGNGADTMTGGAGDDTYIVDNAADVVNENFDGGNDGVYSSVSFGLTANVENLTLTGTAVINGAGNDLANLLIGNSAANVLSGGAGNDIYVIDNIDDVVIENAGAGIDTVQSSVGYILAENVENLTLTGTAAINGAGNDLANLLIGNSAANVLSGGAGNDIYVIDNIDDVVIENAGAGIDTVQSSVGYILAENVENLTLTGTSAINGLGNALDNTLQGNAAANLLAGGAGNDTYIVDAVNDLIVENANEGTDTVQSSISYTLEENVENLVLVGGVSIDGVGNSLNNTLIGNSATNQLSGGAGDDLYIVNNVSDVVIENVSEGIDTISASVTYTLSTEVENLALTGAANINGTGNTLDNVIVGNDGNNVLDGVSGDDSMAGGAGNDTYIVNSAGDLVSEIENAGTDTVQTNLTYTLGANIENLTLTGAEAINGTGNALNNVITGNSAANRLVGGLGNDTYVVNQTGDVVVENANEGTDTVESSISYKLGSNLENLTLTGSNDIFGEGNTGANFIVGNSGANMLQGAAGNDIIYGGAGNDIIAGALYVLVNGNYQLYQGSDRGKNILNGEDGDDEIVAGADGDTLNGGTGKDYLEGGKGNDILDGGTGDDTLFGNLGNDLLDGGAGNDLLNGGVGNDTYLLYRGMGQDRIADVDSTFGNLDTIKIAAGISPSQIIVTRGLEAGDSMNGLGLSLSIAGTTDRITITGFFDTAGFELGYTSGPIYPDTALIERVEFADGTIWNAQTLREKSQRVATSGNDTLFGDQWTNKNDVIYGLAGNDYIQGFRGDDKLFGGLGQDQLVGGEGNDVLNGGEANDWLSDSWGNDVIFGDLGNDNLMDYFGNNFLDGGDGDDLIIGGSGNDVLVGGYGQDQLNGGTGDDMLLLDGDQGGVAISTGAASYGSRTGGVGADRFIVTPTGGGSQMYGLTGSDMIATNVIADFEVSNDKIDLSRFDWISDFSKLQITEINVFNFGRFTRILAQQNDKLVAVNLYGVAPTSLTANQFIFSSSATAPSTFVPTTINVSNGLLWDATNYRTVSYASPSEEVDILYGQDTVADSISALGGNDYVYGQGGNDQLTGGAGDDYLDGGSGNDSLYGNEGADNLYGGVGIDTLDGGAGTDILQGGSDSDLMSDTSGNSLFNGGAGNDTIIAGVGNEFIIGGADNDTISTGSGADVIAFNKGDGQDVVNASSDNDNTLSLGKGIQYADLILSKSVNDLVLVTGNGDQITFKDWYVDANNHSIANLQIVTEGTDDYNASSASQINNKKIEWFNFNGLVTKFDQAQAADSGITSWSLSSSLLEFHLGGSNYAAIGGDFAYQYAKTGSLSSLTTASAQTLLINASFGSGTQNLFSATSVQDLFSATPVQDQSPRLY